MYNNRVNIVDYLFMTGIGLWVIALAIFTTATINQVVYVKENTCEDIFKQYPGLTLQETPIRCLIEKTNSKNPDALKHK